MTTTVTAQADRETPKQFHLTAVTDTVGATTMDWAFGDASVQNGAALTDGTSRVDKTYATNGPFTVTATPKPSGAAGTLAGVTASTKVQPRGAQDPFAPWGAPGVVTLLRGGEEGEGEEPEPEDEAAPTTRKASKHGKK